MGWVRVIVWNIFQKSTDVRVKLSDWDRPLGPGTSGPPGNRFRAIFIKAKLVGWVRVIVRNTFQISKDFKVT